MMTSFWSATAVNIRTLGIRDKANFQRFKETKAKKSGKVIVIQFICAADRDPDHHFKEVIET